MTLSPPRILRTDWSGSTPTFFERVAQLRARGLTQRAAKLVTEAIVSDARLAIVADGGPRIPPNFDSVWPAAADGRVDASDRARFAEAVQQQWFSIGMVQPGWEDERTDTVCAEYRGGNGLFAGRLRWSWGGG